MESKHRMLSLPLIIKFTAFANFFSLLFVIIYPLSVIYLAYEYGLIIDLVKLGDVSHSINFVL